MALTLTPRTFRIAPAPSPARAWPPRQETDLELPSAASVAPKVLLAVLLMLVAVAVIAAGAALAVTAFV